MQEGPGVSISLVGGRSSSIGLIITSNLCFHAVIGRHNVPQEDCTEHPKWLNRQGAPVAFRGVSLQNTFLTVI
jgi:hypothetical protein